MVKTYIEKVFKEKPTVILVRLKNWGLKGGLAILDQGVYSGSNFVFNILLARWLSADNYGAFSLAFAIYLFSTSFYNAMILEPMSVFGTAKYTENIHRYLSGQFVIHVVVTGVSGIFISSAGYILLYFTLVDSFLPHAIIGAGFFLPLMLLMWLARRAFYILSEPGWAFLLSCIYSACLLGGAFYLHFMKVENAAAWFGIMGIASLAGLIVLFKLDIFNFVLDKNNELGWKKLLAEQWAFGKWIVLAAFFNFAATQTQIFITAGTLGLDVAGAFSALQNFMLPMMQILVAISTLTLPTIAFAFGRKDYTSMRRRSFVVAGVLFLFSVLYVVFLFFFAASLENLLYAGRFKEYTWLIPTLGILPLITSIEIGFSLIVRSLQRSIYHAILTFGMAVAGVFSGLLLIPQFGIAGAVGSLILCAVASLLINVWFYRKWFSKALLAWENQDFKTKVIVDTLDSFARSHNIDFIDYLKIDTEGSELAVLQGALGLLEKEQVGVIQFEFNEMNIVSRSFYFDFRKILHNYAFFRLLPRGLLPIPESPLLTELFGFQNILAVHKNKLNLL